MQAKAVVVLLVVATIAGAKHASELSGGGGGDELSGAKHGIELSGGGDGDERSMDYEPQSGMMKICEGASCTQGRRQIHFRLSRLVEVTGTGVPVPDRYVDLEQLSFGFAPLPAEMRDTDGNPFTAIAFQVVRNVSLHGSNTNDIVLNVTGLVAPRPVQIFMYGRGANLTVNLPERALKLYFQIQHWPFQSAQNSLLLVGKIKVKSRKGEDRRPPQIDGDDKPSASPDPMHDGHRRGAPEKRFRLGDDGDGQFLDSPSAVVVDGRVVENAVQVRLNPSDDREMAYAWAFPYFRDTLVYDPTIGMASPGGSGGAPSSSSRSVAPMNSLVFAVIALAFLLI